MYKIKMKIEVVSSRGLFKEGQEYEVDNKQLVQAWVQAGVCTADGFEVKDLRKAEEVDGRKVETREETTDAPKTEETEQTEETKTEEDKAADAPKEDKPKKGK